MRDNTLNVTAQAGRIVTIRTGSTAALAADIYHTLTTFTGRLFSALSGKQVFWPDALTWTFVNA